MSKPRRPMKAPTVPVSDEVLKMLMKQNGGVWGSPKLDGFRCEIQGQIPKTSSLKLFPNAFMNKELSGYPLWEGLDGEVLVGDPKNKDVFNDSTGPLRRHGGEPDFKYYVFDDFNFPGLFYEERHAHLCKRLGLSPENPVSGRIVLLEKVWLETFEAVIAYETDCVEQGYEGCMIRFPKNPYKFGRTTEKEAIILKRKSFVDAEATILGTYEEMLNTNLKFRDAMGNTKRSSHKENKVGKGTLGGFILSCPELWPEPFRCGNMKGVKNEDRQFWWSIRDQLPGKKVTFKYQPHGTKDAPRLPTLKGKESIEIWRLRPYFDCN